MTLRMRLLLVEDDTRIVGFLRRGLEAEGYAVEVAESGAAAIAIGREQAFALIILDIGLPDCNGFEVCRSLREAGVDTPILILTAMDAMADKLSGLRGGADDYMTKPFAFEELLARIEVLLRRTALPVPTPTALLQVADLTLNPETHEVQRGGRPIALTPKEFALLAYFMRSHGKVLSRTRILEQIWGYSSDPMTNVVDVYIRQLRRKIDAGREPKLLHTIRGFGYRLAVL
ncbi:response regulator transcription factor [Methylotetracoccus oryzae]|uniref:response regulator transcription factor n=1 Tax=Methylotetracoccus oryzae TaxID=1919059 RepID=UPI001F1F1DBA|nr:response regulator transcription factor [Methylotetracoccus oryzae]